MEDVHALTILSRIAKDPELSPGKLGLTFDGNIQAGPAGALDKVVEVATGKIAEYAQVWMKTVVPERDVLRRKFEELVWMNTVLYAVSGLAGKEIGQDDKKAFNADFFL